MIKIEVDKNGEKFRIEASGGFADIATEFCTVAEKLMNSIETSDKEAGDVFRKAMAVAIGIKEKEE